MIQAFWTERVYATPKAWKHGNYGHEQGFEQFKFHAGVSILNPSRHISFDFTDNVTLHLGIDNVMSRFLMQHTTRSYSTHHIRTVIEL